MLTEQQLEQRLDFITGSDVAVILGISPYKTPVELWQEKMRLVKCEDISHKKHIIRGNYLERAVADWWADSEGKGVVEDSSFLTHKTIPYLGGNIDRRVKGEHAILECKTSRRADGWDEENNVVPLYYLVQLAFYVAIDDAELGYMAAYIGNTEDFLKFTYDRNANLEEKMLARIKTFWEEHIIKEVPPEPICLSDVIALYGTATDADMIQTPQDDDGAFEDKVKHLSNIKKQMSELTKEEERIKDMIAVHMGKHDTLVDSQGEIIATWKSTKEFERLDQKRLKKARPDLFSQYSKKVSQRVMRIK